MLITPVGLLYSDVQQTLPIVTTFLMLLTPVLYPTPQSGIAAVIARFNPLTPLIMVTRDWLTIGTNEHIEAFVIVTLIAVALLLSGWVAFRVAMPRLIATFGN